MLKMRPLIVLYTLLFVCAGFVSAQNIVTFPKASRVVDVTQAPYNAKGDGKTDATDAIQRALDEHPNGDYIIYLPHGTYRVTKQLSWGRGTDTTSAYRRTIMQGQSTGGTILQLDDQAKGYDQENIPRPVLYTGFGPAPRWRNAVRDLTIKTGKGNPGAIGIRFNAAVQGSIQNVKVFSGDGLGVAGIDMGFAENIGPLLVKQVEIRGFQVGIITRTPFFGMTLEHIVLSGQSRYGIENRDQSLIVRGLRSSNSVTAIYNSGVTAMLTLVDAALEYIPVKGQSAPPAVINEAGLFARNVTTGKYRMAIQDASPGGGVAGSEIREYSSHGIQFLCHTPQQSLDLPVAESPAIAWGNPEQWVAIAGDYGGTAGDGTDDTKAIQQAIDDGAETIYFAPGGRYTITKDVIVRKNVRRIIGTESRIDGAGKFIISDGVPKAIIFERFGALAGGIVHNSKRTLILRDLSLSSYQSKAMGAGDVFLEDVSASPMTFNLQHVWARQLHMNYERGPKITNNGGTIWILGLTTEQGNTIVYNRMGGKVEVVGGHIVSSDRAKTQPMFINDSASISLLGLRETAQQGNPYNIVVRETRGTETKTLFARQVAKNASGGATVPFYVGYIPKSGTNLPPKVVAPPDQILVQPRNVALVGSIEDDGRADNRCTVPAEWNKMTGPGRVALSHPKEYNTWASFTNSGVYDMSFSGYDGKVKRIDTARVYVFDRKLTIEDHNGDNIPSGRGADAWISEEQPTANHGIEPELQLSNFPGQGAKIYLKYDLSALPGPVSDAALQFKVRPRKDSATHTWNVFGIKEVKSYGPGIQGEDWKETELNWNNAPGNSPGESGGAFDFRKASGGGADSAYAQHLGTFQVGPGKALGAFFRTPLLTDFLKKDKNKIVTFIITDVNQNGTPSNAASKEHPKIDAPALYISYLDANKTVGGDQLPGGFRMSPVEVDIYNLQCTFTLMVGQPQNVYIEVYNEFGKRMMILNQRELEGERLTPFQFSAKEFTTGSYTIKVIGEAFKTEQSFYILN